MTQKGVYVGMITLLFTTYLACQSLLIPGFPETHDGQIHLGRIANYYLALKEGQFPPRWAPNLNAGFGYPVFIFNYPLANLLAAPLIAADISVQNAYKVIIILSACLSGWGMFIWLKRHTGISAALTGSIFYQLSSYQLVDMYVRGSIGETLSFAIIPWIFASGERVIEKKTSGITFIISIAALLLAHNLIALATFPVLIVYFVSQYKHQSKRLIKPTFIAILLVSFFWLPALVEKQYTVLDDTPLNKELSQHFPTISQLLISPWGYGLSFPGPVDGFSLEIGLLPIVLVMVSLFHFFRKETTTQRVWFFLLLFTTALFGMLPTSKPFWELFPLAKYFQFPWRLLFFTTVSSAFIIAWVCKSAKNNPVLIIGSLAVLLVTSLPKAKPNFTVNEDNYHWFQYPHTTTTLNENDPPWFRRSEAFALFSATTMPVKIVGKGNVTIESWTGSKHVYQVNANEPIEIIEKTMFFPGWTTSVDHELVDLLKNKERYFGLVNISLEPGNYQIITRFSQQTPARLMGNTLSLVGLTLIGIESLRRRPSET